MFKVVFIRVLPTEKRKVYIEVVSLIDMLGFFLRKRVKSLEESTKSGFDSVKKDMDVVGKWVKHLENKDKQVFKVINELKSELSTVTGELESLRGALNVEVETGKDKQVFKKLPVLDKQTGVEDVGKAVQTAVQTGSFYEIMKGLSSNERLVLFTLMNSDMKLSYEDLAMLLGKERSTVRGQVNSVRQKSPDFIDEIVEKNGKKRVFVPSFVKEKLSKYAKVRGKSKR
ncbi:hypothetical protein CMI47_05750 [Candidatus Pacearchaeota archaeon]|nr:hypothetical protein [Candidatus Pacearchaeota archaeon]|tara:strand:- start:6348 stop:7031 length:684 start_codon:yes stop_codon:yes gene_type:complete